MIGPLAVALLLSGGPHPDAAVAGVRWERNFDDAQRKAKGAHKPMMVDFWARWCGWCQRLDHTTYVDPAVVQLADDFVPVKVNTEGGPRELSISDHYDVSSLPTILFLSPSGRVLMRLDGYQGPGRFPETMHQALETAAKVIGWETALDKNGDDAAALLGLGAHLFEMESYAEAKDLLAKAVRADGERSPSDRKRARMLLGAILKSYSRDYKGAEKTLKDGLAIRPAGDYDAKLLYVLGRTYLSWGKQTEARSALREILNDYGDSSVADKARETLVALDQK